MTGIVTSTTFKSPLKPSLRSNSCSIGQYGLGGHVESFRGGDVLLPETVTSFRSGPGYVRAINNGGVEGSMSRNELLAYFSGNDTGHAYTKKSTLSAIGHLKYNPSPNLHPIAAGSHGPLIGYCSSDNPAMQGFNLFTDMTSFSWVRSDSSLEDIGVNFINNTSPVQSMVDLLVSVAETVHDGLPKPLASAITRKGVKNRVNVIQSIGSEYLGYIFGISPLLSDIRNTIDALNQCQRILAQWIQNNQRQVRRRRRVPTKSTPSYEYKEASSGTAVGYEAFIANNNHYSGPYPNNHFGGSIGSSNWKHTRARFQNVKEKITFSSAFEYDLSLLLPDDKAGLLKAGRLSDNELQSFLLEYLLGFHPSQVGPELIWNLTPWSWMIDWFTNVGTVLDNLRARTSVGMQTDWAYVKTVQERWVKLNETLTDTTNGQVVIRSDVEYKQLYVRRIKASPFGFKVGFDSFTTNQISTLAALAAARLPF